MENTKPMNGAYESLINYANDNIKQKTTGGGLLSQSSNNGGTVSSNSNTSHINWDNMEFESAQAKAARLQAEAQANAPKPKSGGCCFIFMEARYGNGTLDAVVRRYRDDHMTERNKRGYYKLSEVLVPLMRKSWLIKTLVRATMTTPLLAYAKAHYQGRGLGLWLKPVKDFWLCLFDYLGQEHEFIRENGEVV